jgi:hypothetical protein
MPLSAFSEFFITIARDDAALNRFLSNPDGDPAASQLTAAQKAALLSGVWGNIVPLFRDDLKEVERQVDANPQPAAVAPAPFAIGWNMIVFVDKINSKKTNKP